jgi:hypothetical protein
LPGGTDETDVKRVRMAGVPVEIRTDHLPNTSLERHCYTCLLGDDDDYNNSKKKKK